LPGILYVVATPIGNLEDITLRALRILRDVAVVAAEDTRRTGNLLRHYQIRTPLVSYHEHNERQRCPELVARLRGGESIALVSDAGTPGISDPGATLVTAARQAGVRVDAVPGPSAVTAALSASGLPSNRFAFAGFPPVRGKPRKEWLAWVARLSDVPVVCFEAPHRIRKTLNELGIILVNRPILVVRELSKVHEEWTSGDTVPTERGEFVLIIGQSTNNDPLKPGGTAEDLPQPGPEGEPQAGGASDGAEIAAVFGELTKSRQFPSRKAIVKEVAHRLGLPTRLVYNALERAKN
jgi:16S rRNA (cytidine1402-2'-O)-methyltransferase